MKKLILFALILGSITSMGQKITDLLPATGQGIGGIIPIVQNGVTKKINVDSLSITAKLYADSLKRVLVTASNINAANIANNTTAISTNATAISTKQATLVSGSNLKTINGVSLLGSTDVVITGGTPLDTSTIYQKINQNTAAIATKQPVLISGLNLATVNGLSLLTPTNVVIAGASTKPLYKDITAVVGGITLWNFDSSSTAKIITNGTTNIDITGIVSTGATGILTVTQSASGNDTLKYNGTVINIAKQANKTSLVGFIKLATSYIFSVDTTNTTIAQSGGFDVDAQALFTAASTSNSYKTAVDNAIKGLKAITLAAGGTAWSKSVMINGRAGVTLTQQSFNWRNPAQYNYIYSGAGSFVYNPNGTQFNGTNTFVKTGIVPSTSFLGTTSDVAVLQVVGAATATNLIYSFGAYDAATPTIAFYLGGNSTNLSYSIGSNEIIVPSSNPLGRFIVYYSDATTLKSNRNGTLLDSRTVTANPNFVPFELYEGALNRNGTGDGYSDKRIDVTQVINSKLTVAEAQAIDAVWATYQTALSR